MKYNRFHQRQVYGHAGVTHISPNTVRTHIKNLYAKLATHHRAGAVERPRALSLLAPSRTAPSTR